MTLFIAGNLVSAIAPSYELLMLGRVLAALCHGAFFGIGAVVAASLVAPEKKAGAIALMFGGLTIANVLGVPLGTLVGQQWGWRATFWAITGIGVVALALIATVIPSQSNSESASLRHELAGLRSGQVWATLLATVLGFGGMFGAFTYIAFTLTDVSGFSSSTVPWLLVVFGIGMFAGNLLGGKGADRDLSRTVLGAMAVLTVVMALFALLAESQPLTVLALVLMGGFGFATVPGLQMRIMSYAPGAPTLASGANIAAFNVGNALGAWIGGITISAGLGYTSPLWVGALMSAGALAVLTVAVRVARSTQATVDQVPAPV